MQLNFLRALVIGDQFEKILVQDGFDPLLANSELNRGVQSKSALVVDQKCMCIVMCEELGILFSRETLL